MNEAILKKQTVLNYFTRSLLQTKAKKDIGKIFLFGSLAENLFYVSTTIKNQRTGNCQRNSKFK
jgi:hypothetical protein